MSETWTAPGGGRWEQDAEHVPGPITPYLHAIVQHLFAGMADSMREYGIPLAGFDTRLVAGRMYGRARPIGAPDPDRFGDGPKGAPPRPLVRLLFALHPELRRRTKAADETLRTRRWRADALRWRNELEPALRARNLTLGRIDVRALSDAALADHVDRLDEALAEGFRLHGRQFGAVAVPLGMWLERTLAWTHRPPDRVLDVLRGASPASTASVVTVDRIADAVKSAPAAAAVLAGNEDPGSRLSALADCSPELASAIDAWLVEDGYRLVTGVDLIDRTAREMPHLLLDSVAARIARSTAAVGDDGNAGGAAADLRSLVPAKHRSEYDELFADAMASFGIRDDDVWVTTQWPEGILRQALLEAGRRLMDRGAVDDLESVFDTVPGDVPAMLRSAGGPDRQSLAARTAERHRLAAASPPLTFGPDPGPLDLEALPRPVAVLTGAMMTMREIDVHAAALTRTGGVEADGISGDTSADDGVVRGLGVSAGRYTGRARLVLGPPDFARIQAGDVLVARTTSPAYNVLLPLIGAVVTDRGGLLSHAALVAREFGIPAVVATMDATARIADGSRVTVDAERGMVLVQ